MSDRRVNRIVVRLPGVAVVALVALLMLTFVDADAQETPDPGSVSTVPTPTTPPNPTPTNPPATTTTQPPPPPTTEPPEPTTTTRPRTTTTTRPTTATTDEPNPDAAMPGDDDYAYAPATKSSSGSSGGTSTATSSPPTTRAGTRPSSPSASGPVAGSESAAPGPAGPGELPLYHVSSYDPGQWAAPPLGPLQLLDDTWDFDSMLSSMPSLTGRPDDTERLATSLLGDLGSPDGKTPQELAVAATNRPLDAEKAPNLVGVAVAAVLLPLLIFWRFRRRPLPTWGSLGGHRITLPNLRRSAATDATDKTGKPDLTPRRATPLAARTAANTPSRTRKQPNAASAPKKAPRPKHDPGGRTS